jgi:iron complex outermembrane receptor protein
MDGTSGSISASYERYNTVRAEGFFNLPVSDTFALRIAAFSENGDGYIDNNAGPDAGAPDDFGWRLSAAWDVSDDLGLILRYTDIEETGTTAGLFGYKLTCRSTNAQGLTDAFGSVRDCQNPNRGTFAEPSGNAGDEYDISQDFLPDSNLSDENVTLEVNWDAGPVMVKAITSYTDFSNEILSDFDFSPTNASVGGFDEYVEATTVEIVVSSDYEGALQWTAGAYYSDEEFENYFWIYNPVRHDNDVRPTVEYDGAEYTVLNGTPLVSTAIDINGEFGDSNWIETETTAAFFQVEFSVSDNLRLIAGVR